MPISSSPSQQHALLWSVVWTVTSGGNSRPVACTIYQQSVSCFVVAITIGGTQVAECRHQTRAGAVDHSRFLLERLTDEGWSRVHDVVETVH